MAERMNDTELKFIRMEELRRMLENGEPIQIVDVRPAAEREEWSIPGSMHVDAYQELHAGREPSFEGLRLTTDAPVVAVCAAGITSQPAARLLHRRGFDSYSLVGGMKAWSMAWNLAELAAPAAHLIQVRRTGKGCIGYLVASGSDAIVVDAALDPEHYLELAAGRGWVIRHVLDTHIHADHLSRSRSLAKHAGAILWLPEQNRVQFPYQVLRDGYDLTFGSTSLRASATPGHTLESMCYTIGDRWLLTGDTLFTAAVGRPDLGADPDAARLRAELLHGSVRRLLDLDPELMVLPAHSSTPIAFDGVVVGARLGDVRRDVKLPAAAADFSAHVLAHIPPVPANHLAIIGFNEAGELPDGDTSDLEAGANRCAVS